MKFRTTHNSIRLRLRKSELTLLKDHLKVSESIDFPSGAQFIVSLEIKDLMSAVNAKFEAQVLSVYISTEVADQWIDTEDVGIERFIELPNHERLHILIEKDFPCLDRPNEDKSDTFWELADQEPDVC